MTKPFVTGRDTGQRDTKFKLLLRGTNDDLPALFERLFQVDKDLYRSIIKPVIDQSQWREEHTR